jgi:dihydroorotase-like cyclic amidohydrolase
MTLLIRNGHIVTATDSYRADIICQGETIAAIGVEPFDYHPDPTTCAARAIGYLNGIEETLSNGGK